MTVPVQIPYNAAVYAGSSTFGFNFQIVLASDLQVLVDGAARVLGVDYTVSGVGNLNGGTVTYLGSLVAGQLVELRRVTVLHRQTDYQSLGDFLAASVNSDFDRIWQALQESARADIGVLRAPEASGITSLPTIAGRAGTFLAFDAQGNPTIGVPASGSAADVLIQLADRTVATRGAGASGYDGTLNYAVGTVGWHGRSYESVLDHFSPSEAADFVGGAPTLDHTAAFNRATRSTLLFTGNVDSPKRRIDVPPGNYNVAGPVYVRKGQSLCGAGGATRILQNNSLNNALFIMGKGLIAGVETTDPGGLPVVISDIHIESASATYPAIDTGGASGWTVRNAFITNAGLGISVSGGDGIIDGCTFDQGLVGVSFANCQNIVLSNCIFYLGNFQMRFQSNCYDVQMDNMHFEYPQFASILFDDGATSIVNVKVSDSLFVMNAQYSTFTGFVYSRSGDFNAEITSSTFRNMNGYAYQHATGIGGTLAFSDCTFDGRKTNPAYAQSTTAGGIQMMNETVSLKDCRFLNLTQAAVSFSGGFAGRLDMDGGEYSSIGATQAVLLTSTSGGSYARITNVRGDSACPLLNAQGVHSVKLKGNIDWLGQLATAAGRSYFRIPFCGDPLMTSVTIAANTNPTGDARYRRSSKFVISKATDFNGGAISDSLFKVSVAADATDGVSPVIDLQVDIGSVGNGIHVPHTTFGGYIYASVPSTYTAITITADFD